jgi:hypothetical protein
VHHLLVELVPLAILGAIAPVPVAIVITLLMSRDGLAKATSYVAAQAVVYVLLGVVALTVSFDFLGSAGPVLGGIVLALSGIGLWWWAIFEWRRGRLSTSPTPGLLGRLDGMSVRGAAGAGLLVTLVNVKQLGLYLVACADIARSDVSTAQSWTVLVCLLVVVQLTQLLLLVVYVVAHGWATRVLARLHAWLLPRMRAASILLGSVIGTFYLLLAVRVLA